MHNSDFADCTALTGVGLRAEHYLEFTRDHPPIGWIEVHSENYFGAGGPHVNTLTELRANYPLSLHGVGLSLGGTDPLDVTHLEKLKHLILRTQPWVVSEHLAWSAFQGRHFNDLLPLPYTEEALNNCAARITQMQDQLKRQILIENPSSYLSFNHSTISEPEFLGALCARTGCGILLDINNVYVSAINHGFDPIHYLNCIPTAPVGEIHLAGHSIRHFNDATVLIDTHDQPVSAAVWTLYEYVVSRFPAVPVLIERDSNLPPLQELLNEAQRAQSILEASNVIAA
ncbi:MAG: DUF692 domain-containing protein [Gammaproteobacteria bacterium]|nr:DUF692 domain-containing protein [Gammaproteobacteria bacterium]